MKNKTHAFFDSHVHSDNSPDGSHSITYLGIAAQEVELMGFTVTDHCECDLYRQDKYDKSIFQSVFETRKAALVFNSTIKICVGVELGQPLHNTDAVKQVLSAHPFDFVLCSVHNLPEQKDFYFLDYSDMTDEEIHQLLTAYFTELLETARVCDFDSLAHLTYPLRYIVGEQARDVSMDRYAGVIDEILQTLITRGKALELNTSGLRQTYGRTLPELSVLSRFKELGGEYVTIGSDAHYSSHLAAHFSEAFTLLKEAGFSHYTYYEKRQPRFISLP